MRLPQDKILHIDTEFVDGKVNIVAEWQGELVRCKDCKHGEKQKTYEEVKFYSCDFSETEEWFTEDFFCANGERREP